MIRSWKEFSVAVRRQETPFFSMIYKMASVIRSLSFPTIKPFHNLLYHEWAFRTSLWHNFWRIVYYEPIFKSQCVHVGPGFRLEYAGNGTTRIMGDLQIHIGTGVTIFDNTAFVGLKILDKPSLYIGDDTYIGPSVRIMVGREITIGKNCIITSRIITDNQGHPMKEVLGRLNSGGGSPDADDIRPVTIGDYCFLPLDTVVYPGVRIGDGVVARIGTHINRDIPPFCMIAGNPARITRKLPLPDELKGLVGEEKYAHYRDEHSRIEPERF